MTDEHRRNLRRADDLLFGNQPVANIGRQFGNGARLVRTGISVSARGIGAARVRDELRKAGQRFAARGGEKRAAHFGCNARWSRGRMARKRM